MRLAFARGKSAVNDWGSFRWKFTVFHSPAGSNAVVFFCLIAHVNFKIACDVPLFFI